MHKVTLAIFSVLLTACLFLLLPSTGIAGPLSEMPRIKQAIPIAVGPEADSHPALAFGAGGQAHLLWLRHDVETGRSVLMQAQSPSWDVSRHVSALGTSYALSSLTVASGVQPRLAWTGTTTQTTVIGSMDLTGAGITESYPVAPSDPLAIALDPSGGLHASWLDQGAVVYARAGESLSARLSLDAATSITNLVLGARAPEVAHLAWATADLSGRPSGIWYTQIIEAAEVLTHTAPLQVSDKGHSLVLASDDHADAFLTWRQDDSLVTAAIGRWSEPNVLATAVEPDAPFDAAVGPDGVLHVIWAQEGMLWHASSLEWSSPEATVPYSGEAIELAAAVDASGHLHIAWSSRSEDGSGDIFFAQLGGVSPQLAVRFPSTDNVLERDARIRAESNLAVGLLDSIEFYLEREPHEHQGQSPGLVYIGIDQDGSDGWGVDIPVADLVSSRRYRVVALGTRSGGDLLHATGGWFLAQPQSPFDLWVQPLGIGTVSGVGALSILLRGSDRLVGPVDLFLVPPQCDMNHLLCDDDAQSALGSAHYLGSYDIRRQPVEEPQRSTYDSRLVPDGVYRAVALVQDPETDARHASLPSREIVIDNSLPPTIQVSDPDREALEEGRIAAQATAKDLDGSVERVDFYAEREHPLLLGTDQAITMPYRVWLGADDNGADGWSLQRSFDKDWSGDGWRVVAVAFDDKELSSEARSDAAFSIEPDGSPRVRVASPQPGSKVSGILRVILQADKPAATDMAVEGIDLYLGNDDGELTPLGPMQPIGQRWLLTWNATLEQPGACHLQYVVRQANGRETTGIIDNLFIRPPDEGHVFSAPKEHATLQGATQILITSQDRASKLEKASLFYRDAQGQLHPLAEAQPRGNGWGATWHTMGALDGDYVLVAEMEDLSGAVSLIEQPVRIENQTPSIALQGWEVGSPLTGDQSVNWQAEHPSGAPLMVTVLYSPDAGAHWLTLAEEIPASESYLWDTTQSPDTGQGLLRLVVTDGSHQASATTALFEVNNTNQSPSLTILAPQAGSSQRQVRVAWQAWDPDGDALTVKIDYQRDGGTWRRLATDLAAGESFVWDDPPPPAAGPYAFRVTATDLLGAEASDQVENVRLVQGHAPVITLLWPSGDATLRGEAILLWHAEDQDGDAISIDLYYSDNAGQAWLPLVEGLPNTGYFSWQVGFLPTGDQYRVRVVARDGVLSATDESSDTFSVGECSQRLAALVAPQPGDTISGLVQVVWRELMYNAAAQVDLDLRSVGSDEWQQLTSGPNQGFYLWDTTLIADGRYDLRVTLTEGPCLASDVTRDTLVISNQTNSRPQVDLLSPIGGESWQGLHIIAWDAWDPDGDPITLTLSISPDGGQSWEQIGEPNARTGKHIWDTRPFPPGSYLVRARATDGQSLGSDLSDSFVTLAHRDSHPPDVRWLSPNADGALVRGSILAWAADDLDGDRVSVDIALSDDGGISWRDLAQRRGAVGEYALGDALEWDREYIARIRASDRTSTAERISPAFSRRVAAGQRPEMAIAAPRGGERLSGEVGIEWALDVPSPESWNISISSSADGGLSWQSVASDLQGMEAFLWDTTLVANGAYKLALSADNGRLQTSVVSGPLVVDNPGQQSPQVSLVLGRGSQIWSGLEEIVWRVLPDESAGDTAVVRVWLEYSIDRGRSWRLLSSDVGQSGRYTWDTTLAPNSEEFWVRATATQAGRSARTIYAGPISIRNPLAPTIRLLVPREGAYWQGRQVIAWRATRPMAAPLAVTLEYSLDRGVRWQQLERNLPAVGRYILDTGSLPAHSDLLLRATASDGRQTGIDTIWEPIHIEMGARAMEMPFYPR